MVNDDHLDKEISVSAELTDNGVKASARSSALSGIDRLCGSLADYGSAVFEALTDKRREKTQGEVLIIKAAAHHGVLMMGQDSILAQRAFETHYNKVLIAQVNKDAVVAEALEDLRSHPVSEAENNSGPDNLSEEFLNRFETLSENVHQRMNCASVGGAC